MRFAQFGGRPTIVGRLARPLATCTYRPLEKRTVEIPKDARKKGPREGLPSVEGNPPQKYVSPRLCEGHSRESCVSGDWHNGYSDGLPFPLMRQRSVLAWLVSVIAAALADVCHKSTKASQCEAVLHICENHSSLVERNACNLR